MNKNKYHLFRYPNESGHICVVVLNTSPIPMYMEFPKKDDIKVIKKFDNFKEALRFKNAMNLLWRK